VAPVSEKRADARPIVLGIAALVLVLCFYFVLLGTRAVDLLTSGDAVGIGLGIGVMILPFLGIWMVFATLRSGLSHQRLARQMVEEGAELDVSALPRRPSGRIERDAADELFAQVKAEWEADQGNWRATYRIARAYDYAGDRGRAREMMKRAVAQEKEARDTGNANG
jgi:ABC-type nickel/cobalt efflux system permease component RcnA